MNNEEQLRDLIEAAEFFGASKEEVRAVLTDSALESLEKYEMDMYKDRLQCHENMIRYKNRITHKLADAKSIDEIRKIMASTKASTLFADNAIMAISNLNCSFGEMLDFLNSAKRFKSAQINMSIMQLALNNVKDFSEAKSMFEYAAKQKKRTSSDLIIECCESIIRKSAAMMSNLAINDHERLEHYKAFRSIGGWADIELYMSIFIYLPIGELMDSFDYYFPKNEKNLGELWIKKQDRIALQIFKLMDADAFGYKLRLARRINPMNGWYFEEVIIGLLDSADECGKIREVFYAGMEYFKLKFGDCGYDYTALYSHPEVYNFASRIVVDKYFTCGFDEEGIMKTVAYKSDDGTFNVYPHMEDLYRMILQLKDRNEIPDDRYFQSELKRAIGKKHLLEWLHCNEDNERLKAVALAAIKDFQMT